MATSFRSDIVAAIRAVLVARQAASPTLLRAVFTSRPGAFGETPLAYIGGRDERITFAGQTRTRTFSGLTAVVVDSLPDASEEADRMDDLIDLLVDDFTAAVRVGGGLLQVTSVSDADIVLNGANGVQVTYRGAVIGFGDPANPTFIQEGRA